MKKKKKKFLSNGNPFRHSHIGFSTTKTSSDGSNPTMNLTIEGPSDHPTSISHPYDLSWDLNPQPTSPYPFFVPPLPRSAKNWSFSQPNADTSPSSRSSSQETLVPMATVGFNLVGAFKGFSLAPSSSSSYLKGDFGLLSLRRGASVSFPLRSPLTIESAHKKGAGSTKNGRDSRGKRLGVKIYGDQVAQPGAIIVRQRGTKVKALLLKP